MTGEVYLPAAKRKTPAPEKETPATAGVFQASGKRSVAVHLLLELATGLRLDGQRRGGACQQARNADRLARLFAPAVAAVLDAPERLVDLLEQLALAVAGAQLEGVLLFERGLVRRIGLDLVL